MPINNLACLLLCRPKEPAFIQKGNYHFELPPDHFAPRFKNFCEDLLEKFAINENSNRVPVKQIKYPKLDFIKKLNRNAPFSVFMEKHRQYADVLIKLFDNAKDIDELLSLGLFVRDQINSQLFVYAYSVALAHRYDSDDIQLPNLFEIWPDRFFDVDIMQKCRYDTSSRNSRQTRAIKEPVVIPFQNTMSARNPESKVAFFREDIGINSHHWHWHLVYPISGPTPKYYAKDRRGELFAYMHHQVLNIYDCTRLAHRIQRVEPLNNFRECIEIGYYSKLTATASSQIVPPRQDKAFIQDLNLDTNSIGLTLSELERSRDRIHEAIDNGYMYDAAGNVVTLRGPNGIDILVNCVESNALSINPRYYGSLHNNGHVMISFMHDPKAKYDETGAVMADTTTAMRDPIFYRWHKFIDDIFNKLKDQMLPYQNTDLVLHGVNIVSLNILDKTTKLTNELHTFWQESLLNLQNGLDFRANEPSYVSFTHLNNEEFTYSINVQNTNAKAVSGTVRIFLLPIYDEKQEAFTFDGCRKLAIELDRFPVKLNPGTNNIQRKSTESKLTIPLERTFPGVQQNATNTSLLQNSKNNAADVQNFCGCGWPQHMLLPKGNADGYPYRIFVMISDYNLDQIVQPPSDGVCNDCYIFCGLRDRKYPDARAMGYPFDRIGDATVSAFADFLLNRQNMISTNVIIRHLDENNVLVHYKQNPLKP